MTTNRRELLVGGAAVAAVAGMPRLARAGSSGAAATFAPKPGAWKTYEITTTIELPAAEGAAQVWVPVPSFKDDSWMKPGATSFQSPSGKAALVSDKRSGAAMVHAAWDAGDARPAVTVVSRFSGRDRLVSLDATAASNLTPDERKHYTAATELLRTDGIVKETADRIVAGAKSDLDKARRIYDWVVENSFREPKTRGCGTGDIAGMLKSGNLGGKCADLNALFVGLARAAGLPARDIYGIRVAPSAFGFKSLGASSATITKAQHCRAEVFVDGAGWIPADPADVRKVVLEEPPGKLALDDPKVTAVRAQLFGAWETNWLAYNEAHDVELPGSRGPSVPFLMYPQAETKQGRLDSLDPDAFKYSIAVREITA